MSDAMFKLYTPDYYKDFSCKAGECTDTCCTAWEIDIDDETYKLYKAKALELKESGDDPEFAAKLSNSITRDDAVHFDLSGRTYCPFFTKDGLCEIQLKMGESALCQICRDHPRFYEYFPDRKEAGVGICCEKACELVIFNDKPVSFEEKLCPASELVDGIFELDDECSEQTASESNEQEESFNALNDFLFDARAAVIEIIQNRSLSLSDRLNSIIKSSQYIQDMMEDALLFGDELADPYSITRDTDNISDEASEACRLISKLYDLTELKALLSEHMQTIPLKNEWHELIAELDKNIELLINSENSFYNKYADADIRYEQLICYFIFRYACKSLYDGDFLTKIEFAVNSVCIIHLIEIYAHVNNVELNRELLIRIASAYSKEIEYSEENMNLLMY